MFFCIFFLDLINLRRIDYIHMVGCGFASMDVLVSQSGVCLATCQPAAPQASCAATLLRAVADACLLTLPAFSAPIHSPPPRFLRCWA